VLFGGIVTPTKAERLAAAKSNLELLDTMYMVTVRVWADIDYNRRKAEKEVATIEAEPEEKA
jgi:hypothetical protein